MEISIKAATEAAINNNKTSKVVAVIITTKAATTKDTRTKIRDIRIIREGITNVRIRITIIGTKDTNSSSNVKIRADITITIIGIIVVVVDLVYKADGHNVARMTRITTDAMTVTINHVVTRITIVEEDVVKNFVIYIYSCIYS